MKKNKIKKWIGQQAAALSLAMGNAQINMLEQYDDAKTIGMVQKKRQGSLMDDLLAGRLTDEVKAYRSRFWFVMGAESGGFLDKINIDENTVEINGGTTIPLDFTIEHNAFNNQQAGLVDNTSNIKLNYDFIPKFNLQEYIKEAHVYPADNGYVYININVNLVRGSMADGVNKIDLMFTKQLEQKAKNYKLDDLLFNISEITFITDEDEVFPGNITISVNTLTLRDIILGVNDCDLVFIGKVNTYNNPYNDFVQEKTINDYKEKTRREKKYLKSGK